MIWRPMLTCCGAPSPAHPPPPQEARKLEEAVKELAQMFLDMAILVEQQVSAMLSSRKRALCTKVMEFPVGVVERRASLSTTSKIT